jgi:hypothetical protein
MHVSDGRWDRVNLDEYFAVCEGKIEIGNDNATAFGGCLWQSISISGALVTQMAKGHPGGSLEFRLR